MSIITYKKIAKDIIKYFVGTNDFNFLPMTQENMLYPVDLEFTLEDINYYYKPFDDNGIPFKVYNTVGRQYNPTRVAAYGLTHYNNFILKNELRSKQLFIKTADWFYAFENGRYEYKFNWGELKSPWISCMAQGEAVSVLVRAYLLSGEKKYLAHASKSLEVFKLPIEEGGVRSLIDGVDPFLEEYPLINASHVLNGFLYALIGLIDFLSVENDTSYCSLLHSLMNTLKLNLNRWGSGNWSYYHIPSGDELLKNYCTPDYHSLHISQLKFIQSNYPDSIINEVIQRWEEGAVSLSTRLVALLFKVLYRIKHKAQR